jgi:hypothetical protein
MTDDIIIIDDAIVAEQQILLENIFSDSNFYWKYTNESVTEYTKFSGFDSIKTDYSINSFQYVHIVYNGGQESPVLPNFISLLTAIPFTFKDLLKIKVNATTAAHNASTDTCGIPHVDVTPPFDELMTAIYYINDSDGDTFIFNEVYGEKSLSIKQRIQPKRGRLVVFSGKLYHAGNYPTTDKRRLVANINFLPYIKFNNGENK